MNTGQRQTALGELERELDSHLRAAGIRREIEHIAEVGRFRICGARLWQDDQLVSWGAARASAEDSATIATAEAIEHLYLMSSAARGLPDVSADAALAGTAGHSTFGDQLMEWFRRRGAGQAVGYYRYQLCLGDGPAEAWLPELLVTPSSSVAGGAPEELLPLRRYANSTGWGFQTADRSPLRPLGEVLERDTLSRFFWSVVRRRVHPGSAFVDLTSSPAQLGDDVAAAQCWIGAEISVLALQPVPGFYVCLASARDLAAPSRVVGKGASTSLAEAVHRAVGELVQIYAATRSGWIESDDEMHVRVFSRRFPDLLPALMSEFCEGEVNVDAPARLDVGEGTDLADGSLESSWPGDRPVYVRTWPVADRSHVSSVYVPGAERFFLVGHGIPVAPSGLDINSSSLFSAVRT